jgi:peptidoglycan/LPS O-acetylase OafA/YrhL
LAFAAERLESRLIPVFDPRVSGPSQRQFIPRIESMRGIAALTVAAMHVTSSFVEGPVRGGFDRVGLQAIKALTNGYGAVVAFFVISGFVLARSLDKNFDLARFVRARIFRLYPAAIVAVGVFAALYYWFGFKLYERSSFTPLNVLANMLMLRADIDAVMWSMKAEVAATPLIILCVWLFRQYGSRPLITIAAVLLGLSFIGQYTRAIGDDTNLAPIYAFPVGILLHFRGREIAERLAPVAVPLLAIASVALFCGCSFFKPTGTWTLLVQCLSAAVLVLLIAYRAEAAIFVPLDLPVVRFYGRVSYSFYLLHPLALWSAGWLTGYLMNAFDAVPMCLILAVAFVFSVVGITPAAYASWRFVEVPAMNKRWLAPSLRYDRPLAASGDPHAT